MTTVTTTELRGTPIHVVLLLGSNVDAEARMDAALAELGSQFALIARSARHPSAASGVDGAPPYLNQAVVIESNAERQSLKARLREIEAHLGRLRPSPDPRLCPIDIDAIGRCGATFEVWDPKAFSADYARLPLIELGTFCTLP
ncbi:MAG: 2-amino-4-hydroxy-6-hydroxymethyldihydropteridine diphosphokinase [Rhodanobacteraceae bacterium]|nr:2-amino-4-hydroxy-6-hydroxymethyldihydropteridine diphosphokinase [Rhodanobacteraceae bacterium]